MMLPIITLVLVAVCCSPGAGAPNIRPKRHLQAMDYTFYQGGGGGGGGGTGGGYSGSEVQKVQYTKDEAELFPFLFQSCICLYNAVRNGPPEKKPESYRIIVNNMIRFVDVTARSCGTTPEGLFQTKEYYNVYLELRTIQRDGEYGDIARVENACDGVFAGMGGGLAKFLETVGYSASGIVYSLTGIACGLGGVGNLLGGILQAAGGVVSGITDAAGNILGGVANAAGNLVGGVANAAGNLVGGAVNAVTGLAGGLTSNLLSGGGGGGGRQSGFLGGLTSNLLGGV